MSVAEAVVVIEIAVVEHPGKAVMMEDANQMTSHNQCPIVPHWCERQGDIGRKELTGCVEMKERELLVEKVAGVCHVDTTTLRAHEDAA